MVPARQSSIYRPMQRAVDLAAVDDCEGLVDDAMEPARGTLADAGVVDSIKDTYLAKAKDEG